MFTAPKVKLNTVNIGSIRMLQRLIITSKSQTEKYQPEYKSILNEQKVYNSGHTYIIIQQVLIKTFDV